MPLYRPEYPITPNVRAALKSRPNLAKLIKPPSGATDSRHIIRLLDNEHYEGVKEFLNFLDSKAVRWPQLVKRLCEQTSHFEFEQSRAELELL